MTDPFEPACNAAYAASKPYILLVDGNSAARERIERLLSPFYEVEAAPNGWSALTSALRRPPDLLIAEAGIQRLDVFDLLHELKRRPETQEVAVIVYCASMEEDLRIRAFEAGVSDYLIDSLSDRELLARIRSRVTAARIHNERIQALRASKEALRISEERYRTIATAASTAVWRTNANGENVGAKGWEELTGQTLQEYRGLGWLNAVHPDDRPRVRAITREALEKATPVQLEYRLQRREGGYGHVRACGSPLFNPDGSVREWVGMVVDITDQKRAEEALRASEAEFRANFELAGIGQLQTDPKTGHLLKVNRKLCEMLGYSAEELIGRHFLEITHPDDRAFNVESIQPFLRGETDKYTIEKRYVRKDGGIVWVLLTATLFRDSEGKPLRILAMVQDITERRQSEELARLAREQAEAASRIKDEFLAVVSHELRTPLNAINGWVYMLLGNDMDETSRLRALHAIQRNARSQRQLIDDLLDVARIVSGKLRLEMRDVELSKIVTAAIDVVRPAAEAKGIDLIVKLDGAASLILGDPERLQQIIWNLLSNAIKFTPAGGRVEVSTQRVKANVEIRVADSGQGIAPEFLPHVFERFRQADISTTRAHGGLGLGLAIVRHLTEMHGGAVRAESEGKGKGAVFTVSLPARADRRRPERAWPQEGRVEAMRPEPGSLAGLNVLVVDDDADTREAVIAVLSHRGAQATACASADEALAQMDRATPDVVVADIGMPGEDGYSLIRKIRSRPSDRGGQTPAIALTAYAGEANRRRALEAGYQRHMAKPVELDDLARAIAQLTT